MTLVARNYKDVSEFNEVMYKTVTINLNSGHVKYKRHSPITTIDDQWFTLHLLRFYKTY